MNRRKALSAGRNASQEQIGMMKRRGKRGQGIGDKKT